MENTIIVKFIDSDVNTKWDIIKLPNKKSHYDVKTLLRMKGKKVNKILTWKSYRS